MALNCGIIGLTNTGKTTIFNCISNTKAEIGGFATKTNIGMCEVRDERLKLIDDISHSKRIVPATGVSQLNISILSSARSHSS